MGRIRESGGLKSISNTNYSTLPPSSGVLILSTITLHILGWIICFRVLSVIYIYLAACLARSTFAQMSFLSITKCPLVGEDEISPCSENHYSRAKAV